MPCCDMSTGGCLPVYGAKTHRSAQPKCQAGPRKAAEDGPQGDPTMRFLLAPRFCVLYDFLGLTRGQGQEHVLGKGQGSPTSQGRRARLVVRHSGWGVRALNHPQQQGSTFHPSTTVHSILSSSPPLRPPQAPVFPCLPRGIYSRRSKSHLNWGAKNLPAHHHCPAPK